MFKFFYPQSGSNILVYNNIAKNNHVIVFLNKNQHQLLKAYIYTYIYTLQIKAKNLKRSI